MGADLIHEGHQESNRPQQEKVVALGEVALQEGSSIDNQNPENTPESTQTNGVLLVDQSKAWDMAHAGDEFRSHAAEQRQKDSLLTDFSKKAPEIVDALQGVRDEYA
ncbi:MAG: hypothetical protein WAW80_05405 [Candidatus Saccharimonadales bacterium]